MHHAELGPLMRRRMARTVDELAEEFHGVFSRGTVERFVQESSDRLGDRRVTGPNFLPLLVGRFARERLWALAQVEGRVEKTKPEVLFVCTHNAGRSQMARAFFDRDTPADLRAESAGTQPAREIWRTVVEAMAEVGIDLSGRRPQKLLVETQLHADWAVTMGCGDVCPYVPTMVENWDVPDPAGLALSDVRAIRDGIEGQVRELIDQRLDAIYADRTAHQLRLANMLPALAAEFAARRSDEEIRACADAILTRYDDAPVRSYTTILATRQARECLRAKTCDALVAG